MEQDMGNKAEVAGLSRGINMENMEKRGRNVGKRQELYVEYHII